MTKLSIVLLLAALVLVSGFEAIHSEMELLEGDGTEKSSGNCGKILTSQQMFQKQLETVDVIVQGITSNLKDNIDHGCFKLLEKIEHFMKSKFDELDKKTDIKFHKTKTYMTAIEDKISEYTSHVDSKINTLESRLTHALNVSDTFNSNDACCKICSETAAFVKNTTTKINDMNIRTLDVSVKLQEMNEAIQNLTEIVVKGSHNKNIPKQNDTTISTEPAHNVSDIITNTEVNKPAASKCGRSQQEECCTEAVVDYYYYREYTEMSARGRHTVVNMTSAGLQEYTMYFAVRGSDVFLLLTASSVDWSDLYYKICFFGFRGGHMRMYEQLPSASERTPHDIVASNFVSTEKYSYYYLHISGDTLEVGRRGEPPLMTHTSTVLRKLKYFSFASMTSTTSEALYDCPAE